MILHYFARSIDMPPPASVACFAFCPLSLQAADNEAAEEDAAEQEDD